MTRAIASVAGGNRMQSANIDIDAGEHTDITLTGASVLIQCSWLSAWTRGAKLEPNLKLSVGRKLWRRLKNVR